MVPDCETCDEIWALAMISKIIVAAKALPFTATQEQKLAAGWKAAVANQCALVWPKASCVIVDHC